jgi:hypothetical protein
MEMARSATKPRTNFFVLHLTEFRFCIKTHAFPENLVDMRPLTEPEAQTLFKKLASFIGASLKDLIAPLDDSPNADRYVFRLCRDRVYYVRLSLVNLATSIPRNQLLSLGVCLGE